jgi:hypothetical protein
LKIEIMSTTESIDQFIISRIEDILEHNIIT